MSKAAGSAPCKTSRLSSCLYPFEQIHLLARRCNRRRWIEPNMLETDSLSFAIAGCEM